MGDAGAWFPGLPLDLIGAKGLELGLILQLRVKLHSIYVSGLTYCRPNFKSWRLKINPRLGRLHVDSIKLFFALILNSSSTFFFFF